MRISHLIFSNKQNYQKYKSKKNSKKLFSQPQIATKQATCSYPFRPSIVYLKAMQLSKQYCLTIDHQALEGDIWPEYGEEEYPIYISCGSSRNLQILPIRDPVLLLHKYGGTYGELGFLLKPLEEGLSEVVFSYNNKYGANLVDRFGSPIQSRLQIPVIASDVITIA
ncbi:MAG: hypothetical protein SFU25_07340 [Candidatus Caenarcaniphilales bacterium]|nr:hypothetical protein [Candidatus Caenarcaniphilales bacterium]